MDPSSIYSLIQRINSGDTASAESELESYRQTHINELVSSLATVITQFESEIPVVQSALLILKTIVPKSWSIAFEEFQGPAISQDIKSKIRTLLVTNLLGHPVSKVRSVAALLTASIASAEYPDEWPNLIDEITGLALNGNQYQLFGALSTLKELVGETISEAEFRSVGAKILSSLYTVASAYSSSQNLNPKFPLLASAIAFQVFAQCADLFAIPTKPNSPEATIVSDIINQWAPLAIQYISKQINPLDVEWLYIKLESLKAFSALLLTIPKITSPHASQAFESVTQNLEYLLPSYIENNIENTSPLPSEEIIQNSGVFVNEDVTLDSIIYEEFELLGHLVNHKSIALKLTNIIHPFFQLLTNYSQISKEDEESWTDDMNEFVKEESDLSIRKAVRSQIPEILMSLDRTRQFDLLGLYFKEALSNFDQSSWKLQEASLYLLSWILAEDHESHPKLVQESIDTLVRKVSEFHYDTNHNLLRARSYIAGGSICKSLKDRIDVAAISIPLFESTASAAISDSSDTVKGACLIAFSKYCQILPKDYITTKLTALYEIIGTMTPKAEEDTPAMFAEVLMNIIQSNFTFAVRYPSLIEIVYNLLSRDPTNVMLTNEIVDIMEELAETATDEDVYNEFLQHSLPPLLQSIMSITDWEYTPELVLSLNILGVIVDKGPYPVPEIIVDKFFDPLYKIAMNSSDNQVLQSATEILSFLTRHASNQIQNWSNTEGRNGVELLIIAIARLLDPSWEDSACMNTGLLILAIVDRFGPMLGEYLPQILEATAKRLAISKHPVLIENFIGVFSALVATSATEVIDFLASQQIADENGKPVSGLEVVISKWLANFDVLRGYNEIKANIVSLGKLYELQDPRIAAIQVDGDPVPVPKDVILTRSKARQYASLYTPVSAPCKIIKLFIHELISGKFALEREASEALKHVSQEEHGNDEEDDDGEWEDLDDTLLEGGMTLGDTLKYAGIEDLDGEELFDEEGGGGRRAWGSSDHVTQYMIADWLKHVVTSDVGNFKANIYESLNQDEKEYLATLLK
ncbi:uncharacterized protein SAPINGB_P002884 [Magnusiomyces paraingens]|uniref:Importin N-terminal domain-containing protein n=1 Tax=Magnusiomyces paraingens TaxID=2606893 RepID=A0A5E8BGW5_9ASCO|nr:uncharacterized protein SAPINGB_P002884 [Saprochaete ingens]VVT50800.1 unnamed protein product [Saprochaete ingens]